MAPKLEGTPRDNIRRTVRLLMKWHGLTGPQLAEMLGCSHQAVYNKLNGRSDFTAPEIDGLASGFGVDHNLLFGDPEVLRQRVGEVIGVLAAPNVTPMRPRKRRPGTSKEPSIRWYYGT